MSETELKLIKNQVEKFNAEKCNSFLEEGRCGFWIFKGESLQKFANQKCYAIFYSIVGFILSMTSAYFEETLPTIEKRYGISFEVFRYISLSYEFSQLCIAGMLSYAAGKGHRPRGMGVGLLVLVFSCVLMALPHFLFKNHDRNLKNVQEVQHWTAQVLFFVSYILSSFGFTLFYTLGTSYMDDCFQKSKVPLLLATTYVLRLLGPLAGKSLAKFCLSIYATSTETQFLALLDPLGAWWLGWLIFGVSLAFFACLLPMFPENLPTAAKQRVRTSSNSKIQLENFEKDTEYYDSETESEIDLQLASLKDMLKTFKDFIDNRTFVFNHLSMFFFYMAAVPYAILMPKYIHIEYRQSTVMANLISEGVGFIFSCLGFILSGFWISRFKPCAGAMAAWNVLVGCLSIFGLLGCMYLNCAGNEQIIGFNKQPRNQTGCNRILDCNAGPYLLVCGENKLTYLSACHAGCDDHPVPFLDKKIFNDCTCIPTKNRTTQSEHLNRRANAESTFSGSGGKAFLGACSLECNTNFVVFIVVFSFVKFFGASTRASKFLINVRSISSEDKSAAMGFDVTLMSLVTLISSQQYVFWLFDSLFALWGTTFVSLENAWIYDAVFFRYIFNLTAIFFFSVGTLFDIAVWFNVRNLKVFDARITLFKKPHFTDEKEK